MTPPDPLRGKTALITGASGGLGRAVALELAGHGCRLFLTGRNRDRIAAMADAIEDRSKAYVYPADLANPVQVDLLAAWAITTMGQVDILVNAAAVFPVLPLEESTPEALDACLAVNVRAPFLLARRLAPAMAARGGGRIVNVASSSAYAGFKDTSIYCLSKHALLGLSRALHDELKGRGVRVYCLSPGSMRTEMGARLRGQDPTTFIRPEEVARYLAFVIGFDREMVTEEIRLNRMEYR